MLGTTLSTRIETTAIRWKGWSTKKRWSPGHHIGPYLHLDTPEVQLPKGDVPKDSRENKSVTENTELSVLQCLQMLGSQVSHDRHTVIEENDIPREELWAGGHRISQVWS